MKEISIKPYFANNILLQEDLLNGFTPHKNSYLKYYSKGKSTTKKDFLFATQQTFYILDYAGNLKKTYNISDLNYFLNDTTNYAISNIQQLDTDKYCLIVNSKDPNLYKTQDYLLICQCKNNLKILEAYTILLDLEGIIKEKSINQHAYIYKGPGHVYLYTQDLATSIEIIQEQKDGKIIWQWDSTKSKDLKKYLVRKNDGLSFHLNYFIEYDENHLLISFRNLGLVLLNKHNFKSKWICSSNKNLLGLPAPNLQHSLEKIDSNTFVTFNNNWYAKSEHVETFLTRGSLKESDFKKLGTSSINIYNLEKNTALIYNTKTLASPRSGNVLSIDNSIFDINYGTSFIYNNNILYRLGKLEEINIETGEKLLEIKFNIEPYIIRRGL